ncbi:MAG: AAA family ATPase [Magnetococcales bacterium]|nr:AAA family ATPase [Magnetococcales bacterium]
MPRIIIKNFGPVRDVDLEIRDLVFLIGPQASGKSTIMM